jgi:hypothetical protein
MKFSQFISEMESMDTEPIVMTVGSDARDSINQVLEAELLNNFATAEDGFDKIRNIFNQYGAKVPMMKSLDSDGDEIALDVDTQEGPLVLYVIYSLTDEGDYEFYAELTDEDGLEEIISDDEEEDEVEKD